MAAESLNSFIDNREHGTSFNIHQDKDRKFSGTMVYTHNDRAAIVQSPPGTVVGAKFIKGPDPFCDRTEIDVAYDKSDHFLEQMMIASYFVRERMKDSFSIPDALMPIINNTLIIRYTAFRFSPSIGNHDNLRAEKNRLIAKYAQLKDNKSSYDTAIRREIMEDMCKSGKWYRNDFDIRGHIDVGARITLKFFIEGFVTEDQRGVIEFRIQPDRFFCRSIDKKDD